MTARAGTPLRELESVLAERGQCLPFEPPRFAPGGTVGGMVAAGISGPSRAASARCAITCSGVTLLNGRGELVTFGGQVMKNVAGYDVSRLMAGSWGVLGILCEVSLKVLATRAAAATLEFDRDESDSLDELARWRALPLPVHSTTWYEGRLRVRLAGAGAAVRSARDRLAGAQLAAAEADAWWESVRDHRTHSSTPPRPISPPANAYGASRCRPSRRCSTCRVGGSSSGAGRSAGCALELPRRRCAA